MMVEKMVPLCMLARISSTLKMWPQTEYPLTGVERCQAWALSAQSLSEGLTHPGSRALSLLQDAPVPILGLVLVVALLSKLRSHRGPSQTSYAPKTTHHKYHKYWGPRNLSLSSNRP